MFECGQATILFVHIQSKPTKADNTAANRMVADVDTAPDEIISRGLKVEIFDLPDADCDDKSAVTKGEVKGAWIKDPPSNNLRFNRPA